MESYCQNYGSPASGEMDRLNGYQRAGLNLSDAQVLVAYVEVACLDPDLAAVKMSAYEVSVRAGLSLPAVKRAIAKLMALGLLVRRQDIKMAGVMAWTQVTKTACALVGVRGGADLSPTLPSEVRIALAGECTAVCKAVSNAWDACESLPNAVDGQWRGGAIRLESVRSYLSVRSLQAMEACHAASQARAVDPLDQRNGMVRIACPGGAEVRVDASHLHAGTPCASDLGFAKDVLLEVAVRQPDLVTPTSIPRLLAEILYSRAVGFLQGREYTPAVRILASSITSSKQAWGRPRGIRDQWYMAAQSACRFSTGSSISVH